MREARIGNLGTGQPQLDEVFHASNLSQPVIADVGVREIDPLQLIFQPG